MLGPSAPPEHRFCQAVVTKVAEAHCTVVVLDAEHRTGVGECWPGFADLHTESCTLRLGSRVVVEGMQSAKTRRLNGLTGVISSHPRQGHPTFVRKPSAPDRPQLTVCVVFDDPVAAGERSALLEPRFLVPYSTVAEQATGSLSAVLATLGSLVENAEVETRAQAEETVTDDACSGSEQGAKRTASALLGA